MGKTLRVITGRVTAPSTTFTALTMSSGDSLAVQNFKEASKAYMLNAWGDWQTAGNLRIRSPKMHDNVQGIRLFGVASEVAPLWPLGIKEEIFSNDTLTVDMTGSATCGDIESAALMLWYEDLPGQDARLMSPDQVRSRTEKIFTVENTLSLGTGGGYSGEEALTAEFTQQKPNTDYALLGYQVSAECLGVFWRSSETGNVRVGGPGNELRKEMTGRWFMLLSEMYGLPLVPVFNSDNWAAILLDGVQDENGTDTTVTSIFAQLRK
jgi:hypothetical protein